MKTKMNWMVLAVVLCGAASGVLPPKESEAAEMDLVDTAVSAGSFKTLAQALTAADLVETLKGDGPYTVFAPTDAAFAKLPQGTLDTLLKDKAKLTKVLLYHVVPGAVRASDVVNLEEAATAQGQLLRIETSGAGVQINDANVIKADIEASNGVIHVVDTVLIPQGI